MRLPERPETGKRYELHDGEVIVVPPARPLYIKLQKRIERLLETAAGNRGVVTTEFPYRPVLNLQYWFADVAYIPQADWDALPPDEYPVYASPLIVEVLFAIQYACQGEPPAYRGPLGRHAGILGGGCRAAHCAADGSARRARIFGQ